MSDTVAPTSGISRHNERDVDEKADHRAPLSAPQIAGVPSMTEPVESGADVVGARLSAPPSRASQPQLSDAALVDRAKAGEMGAFAELVTRHRPRLMRLAVHMLKSRIEAEDVTQEAFIRAFRAIDKFDGRSEPYTWLYRILINLSLNVMRARRTARVNASSDDPRLESVVEKLASPSDPAKGADQKRLYDALASGIDELSETLRCTLILVCIDGRTHEEVATILGIPEGTVAWRVHEARKKLRVHLIGRGFDPNASEVET